MQHRVRELKLQARARRAPSAIGAAVLFAIYGSPTPALAQGTNNGDLLEEITVTASRRQQTLTEVPYNITAVSGEALLRTSTTDLIALAKQVPALNVFELGARFSASTIPIIRGLNASTSGRGFRSFEQAPVGTYLGNSPLTGYFDLDDIQRVEVLRGPQGTLYGAGALGGALRLIPNAPELGQFSARFGIGGGGVNHSDDQSYMVSGMINVPLGETLAWRTSAKYDYSPGVVEAFGLLVRDGNDDLHSIPILANPGDVVNSPGVFREERDWDYLKRTTGRTSLRWQPSDVFSADLAYTHTHLDGNGDALVNEHYAGGPYGVDPRITLPPGGDYVVFASVDLPYRRDTGLSTLDLSYDLGFATLAATSTYANNHGASMDDYGYLAVFPAVVVRELYAGTPVNPRYISNGQLADDEQVFTQEVRLVSSVGPDKKIDYVVGAFYQEQDREGKWNVTVPGTPEYNDAQGCDTLWIFGGCRVGTDPTGIVFQQLDTQHFEDVSVFGELSWHFSERGQITFGGRYSDQTFTDAQTYNAYPGQSFFSSAQPIEADFSNSSWKVNPSYEYVDNHRVYATWSQGFRRGGANALPEGGFYRESQTLLTYTPDEAENYEVGLKGRFGNGLSYTVAAFQIDWDRPQISSNTAAGNLLVYNGKAARSRGFEVESSGPLFGDLTYSIGFAYADAKLTESFFLPANTGADTDGDGQGDLDPNGITGEAGTRLPGSPKTSGAATLNYDTEFAADYALNLSFNVTYKSEVLRSVGLPPASTPPPSEAYTLGNFSASLTHGSWTIGGYVNNVADRRVLFSGPTPQTVNAGFPTTQFTNSTINRPREFGLRMFYNFGN